ncbi:MAG: glycosyltransferase family 4 protein [Ktedonobacteraceae bacterium]
MRILMLAQFYPPLIGGEERHVRNLSIELASRGHDVSVATMRHKGDNDVEVEQGVRVHRIRSSMQRASAIFSETGRQYAPPFPDPELMLSLSRIVQSERPQIIHAHNWMLHSYTPLKALYNAKFVVTLHDYSMVCATKRLMYQNEVLCAGPNLSRCLQCAPRQYGSAKGIPTIFLNTFASMAERKAVDMFIPVSGAVAAHTQLAHHKAPYRVIHNFVPSNVDTLYDDSDPRLSQLPQEDYLLFVGDVRRDKGVDVLFQAYAGIQHAPPLALIGKMGSDLTVSAPPNSVNLQSWPHKAVMSALRRSSLVIVPSVCADACPTVAIEAMAMGRPIIGSRIGGLTDIVADGETGLLVPPGDVGALRAAIQSLLDDPVRRRRMGIMAKKRVEKFYASRVVTDIEQVYQELLAK